MIPQNRRYAGYTAAGGHLRVRPYDGGGSLDVAAPTCPVGRAAVRAISALTAAVIEVRSDHASMQAVGLRVLVSFIVLVAASTITVGSVALEPAHADQESSQRGPVPSDVRTHLRADYGITVPAATRGTPRITAEQALRTADNEDSFGGTAVSAHLVLYSDPESGEAENEIVAAEDDVVFTPLYMDHLTWLVVIRGASPPVFGPPGRSGPGTYDATVAVFVDAKTGGDLGAVTLPPGQ